MLEGVPRQGGVVGFNVQLELFLQPVGTQEVHAGGRVKVVLVLGGLLGLRLNVKVAVKADFSLIIHCHVHKMGQIVQL